MGGSLLLSTYPPEKCGIAVFSQNLFENLGDEPKGVLAVGRPGETVPGEVWEFVDPNDPDSYREAARKVNGSPFSVVNIQHEFGIFGGPAGAHLLPFLERLEKPVVTTLHTVLPDPTPEYRRMTEAILERSRRLVVLSRTAIGLLKRYYRLPSDLDLLYIPHGVPEVPLTSPADMRAAMGLPDRPLVLTFGLLSRGKGIEVMLDALGKIRTHVPNVLYVYAGQTHPKILAREGLAYRRELESLVQKKRLEPNVLFYDRYLTRQQVVDFLQAADVYVCPYIAPNQIVSGTLAYAAGCGRAIVSTPTLYARELLDEDRGLLVPFANADTLAEAVIRLLGDQEARDSFGLRCYAHTRSWIWPAVGNRYTEVHRELVAEANLMEESGPVARP